MIVGTYLSNFKLLLPPYAIFDDQYVIANINQTKHKTFSAVFVNKYKSATTKKSKVYAFLICIYKIPTFVSQISSLVYIVVKEGKLNGLICDCVLLEYRHAL